jgi:tetratricopeptide (TPR) repeat protein
VSEIAKPLNKRVLWFLLSGMVVALLPTGCRHQSDPDPVVSPAVSTQDLIAKADSLYAGREDISKVRSGLATLREARVKDYKNYDVLWHLAKYNYYLGSHTKTDAERDKAFSEGIEAGKAAVAAEPGRVEGHFWLGANYGGSAQTGTLAGLATVSDIREQMNEVIKIDPSYEGASAYMVLGQVDLEAPKLFGGNPAEALETLEKGVRLAGDNSMLRLRLAQAFSRNNRPADALKQIDDIEKMRPDPAYLPEHQQVLTEAKELKGKIEEQKPPSSK